MKKYLSKIERYILRLINRIFYGGKQASIKLDLMSCAQLNDFIYKGLISDKSFMAARFGYIEQEAALYPYIVNLPIWKRYYLYAQKKIDFLHYSSNYAQQLMNPLCNNAGFFPNDISLINEYFKQLCINDAHMCDCLCLHNHAYEEIATPFLKNDVKYALLKHMEPYDYANPWSRALAGKKVLVIHPFAKTIEKQYQNRKYLWSNPEVLPDFELKTIKAVQTIAGETSEFNTWFDALHYMEQQMDALDYDVAIIGCGAYGFSLAAHAKRMGKKAIHLGGATQILFGIKGKRWDELPAVNKFYNEYWVYPSVDETPKNKERVENGCYW